MDTKNENVEDPYNVQYWATRWSENKTGFHKNHANPNLLKYIGLVTGQEGLTGDPLTDASQFELNSRKTFFVPLCGKSLDIPYLLSQGFRVFAVEGVKQALEQFVTEQKQLDISYNEAESIYTGANGKLTIYLGDFFKCPVEKFGPIDYVWDRGSFVAVEYGHRPDYIKTMQMALKGHPCRYLLECVRYDKALFGGPPRSVPDEDIDENFRSWADATLLEELVPPEDTTIFKTLGDAATMRLFLIVPKP